MITPFLIEELILEYEEVVQKLKYRHPSYFDEYKSAMVEIYPERVVSDVFECFCCGCAEPEDSCEFLLCCVQDGVFWVV